MGTNTNDFSLMALAALKRKTQNRKERAAELYDQGLTLEAIAKEIGTSTRSVQRYLPGVKWLGNTKEN